MNNHAFQFMQKWLWTGKIEKIKGALSDQSIRKGGGLKLDSLLVWDRLSNWSDWSVADFKGFWAPL